MWQMVTRGLARALHPRAQSSRPLGLLSTCSEKLSAQDTMDVGLYLRVGRRP